MESAICLAFVDHRFSRMAVRQLKGAFPNCRLTAYKVFDRGTPKTVLFEIESEGKSSEAHERYGNSKLSFVDFIMPVDFAIKLNGLLDYGRIGDSLLRVCGKHPFKIEVKKVDFHTEESAKSIEVRLGTDLEGRGLTADLKNPELTAYVVLLRDRAIIGHAEGDTVLDTFRSAGKSGENALNRSEFKIAEAAKFFGIDPRRHKLALDVGSSPGGWVHYLSRHGIRVVAVDAALLDYKTVAQGRSVLVLTNRGESDLLGKLMVEDGLNGSVIIEELGSPSISTAEYDIIHIKANLNEDIIRFLKVFGGFDLLTIDVNLDPVESSTLACSLAPLLDRSSPLLMTLKLPTKAFARHISAAEAELSTTYGSIRMKKLPHNRQEITTYGILRES